MVERTLGDVVHYMGALVISYAVGITSGFWMHRRIVFDVTGNLFVDFLRFVSVHLAGFAMNAALLPILVEVLRFDVLAAQLIATAVVTVSSYFGHSLFSFRRPVDTAPATQEH